MTSLGVSASYDPICSSVFARQQSSRQPFRSRAASASLGAISLLGACAVLLRSSATGGRTALDFAVSATGSQSCQDCVSKAAASPVRFDFCPKPAHFTPIYEAHPHGGNVASVNAGDYNLYVGGSAINAAFRNALQLDGANGYEKLHKLMLAEAEDSPGALVQAPNGSEAQKLAGELGLLGCFAKAGSSVAADPVGTVIVDIFAPGKRPLSQNNVAMVYVVGPRGGGNGAAGASDFLHAVSNLGSNALTALSAYNQIAKGSSDLPNIDVLQWCLVSGGLYRDPSTSKLDVAKATVRGMLSGGASAPAEIPLVRFAYDHGVFESAVREIIAPAA